MYLNPARIMDRFPGAYPQALKISHPGANDEALTAIWQNKVEAEIAHYSGYIDGAVGDKYPYAGTYKFPAWDAVPKTPATVSEICYLLSYASLIEYFSPAKKGVEDEDERSYKDRAESMLNKIRKGEISLAVEESIVPRSGAIARRTNQFTDDNYSGFGL